MKTRVQLPDIRKALLEYIDTTILPRYEFFDLAHRREHAEMVMSRALDLAAFYPVDKEMLYVAAAYHDWAWPKDASCIIWPRLGFCVRILFCLAFFRLRK